MKTLILATVLGTLFLSSTNATEQNKKPKKINSPAATSVHSVAGDHNSTRSNRGTIVAPVDTDDCSDNQKINTTAKLTQPLKGRNPQTGKEISAVSDNRRKGRNPQTGKEINIQKKLIDNNCSRK